MISVEQALSIVKNNSFATSNFEIKKIHDALGFTLFEDITSPINMPPFRQSAMDGFALNLNGKDTYAIIGEIKAGDGHHPTLNIGEAVRIFTGAPVPDTANAVVMQEKVTVDNSSLIINTEVSKNENIRPLGEQVLKGEIALCKGTRLNPAGIAFLSALGIEQIKVFKSPSIAVVATGNELVEPGQNLGYGQIYESNTTMLSSALIGLGFKEITTYKVKDSYNATVNLLDEVITNNDVILISGGISVGDYDFVGRALHELGVGQQFYKVHQKPGKPLFFGKKGIKNIFALPGNPAAALSCFYIYVYPTLQIMCGNKDFSLIRITGSSQSSYVKKSGRPEFLKAFFNDGKVELLEGQNSSMLHTFALANALVYLPDNLNSVNINDNVEVILLPIN